MKEYDKEKLNEYVKELFELCLEKGIIMEDYSSTHEIRVHFGKVCIRTFLHKYNFSCNSVDKKNLILPIWELIEKVKAL